jgi:phosphoserine phosphatase RsbU/P
VVRLDAGGPVIWLMEGCRYEQGGIALEPGDLFVAFTDGITEAMDLAEEDWGEDRLIEAVGRAGALSPHALIEHIMQHADGCADGAPQHDDMTVAVACVSDSRSPIDPPRVARG